MSTAYPIEIFETAGGAGKVRPLDSPAQYCRRRINFLHAAAVARFQAVAGKSRGVGLQSGFVVRAAIDMVEQRERQGFLCCQSQVRYVVAVTQPAWKGTARSVTHLRSRR